jgi:two-component sensor histidine kinase
VIVGTLERIAAERTDLTRTDIARLRNLVAAWDVLADLSLADLVLWLPTWNEGGFVAAALVRPATAPTTVPDDIVGSFVPRGRRRELDQALGSMTPTAAAVALRGVEGRPIAVVARTPAVRAGGLLDEVYLDLAEVFFAMLTEGTFPPDTPVMSSDGPRVGDGLLRLDDAGLVVMASPNATSAFRRLGLATPLLGSNIARTAARLVHRPGPVDEAVTLVMGGRVAGDVEIGNSSGSMIARSWPLRSAGRSAGALVLVRDVTDARTRDRALLSKDAALREVHHRVKNNLQTVSSLLRLQSRRVSAPEAQAALAEAGRRVASIAAVHDILAVEPGATVSVDEVLSRLVSLANELAPGHSRDRLPPRIVVESTVGEVSTDVAGPLAMAVSELLANAVEHAQAQRISARAYRETAGDWCVEVCDDGSGMPQTPVPGLGMQIVTMLIEEDLHGDVQWVHNAGGGTCAVVRIPHITDERT